MTDARCEPPSELRGKDGWHWVVWTPTGETEPYNPVAIWWDAEALGWCPDLPKCADTRELTEYRYLSPVLTPAEVAALRAERDAAVAEVVGLKGTVASVDEDNDALRATIREMSTSLTTIRAEVEKLKRLLEECANDLAMEIDSRYPNAGQHPSEAKRRDRDMEIVNLARAELNPEPANAVEVPE